jgi:hypothetical protein
MIPCDGTEPEQAGVSDTGPAMGSTMQKRYILPFSACLVFFVGVCGLAFLLTAEFRGRILVTIGIGALVLWIWVRFIFPLLARRPASVGARAGGPHGAAGP